MKKAFVKIAVLTDNSALVNQGLAPGDIIVSKGVQQLYDQQKVSLLNPKVLRYNP